MCHNVSQSGAFPHLIMFRGRSKHTLDDTWAEWFEGLTITLEENGDTLLTGPVADQAALHGLLKKVRDLGLPLVSVVQVPYCSKKRKNDYCYSWRKYG